MKQINIEGYLPDQILSLPDEQLDAFVLSGRPIVFRAGSAEILGVDIEGGGKAYYRVYEFN